MGLGLSIQIEQDRAQLAWDSTSCQEMQGSPQSGLERHLQPSKQSPNRSGLAIDAPDLLVGSYKTGRMEETEAGEARG